MPPSMRKQAWENLVAEGTNKLCAAGLSLAYADVSDEQKKCLGMTEEAGYTASFNIGEVPCVAASKPAGCGEECIVVMYNSSDVNCALNIVKCAGSLRGLANFYSIKDVAIANRIAAKGSRFNVRAARLQLEGRRALHVLGATASSKHTPKRRLPRHRPYCS